MIVKREQAIELILNIIPRDALVVACNGKLGRELWELRRKRGESDADFILIGAMGCALPVAVGLARTTKKKVICLLGDGNFLMKMGALATMRRLSTNNLTVYVLNNNCHDSTGGQETSFSSIRTFLPVNVNFRVIDIATGAREDLGRPTLTPSEITANFMQKC
jgi:phosphonopyruvate decarboxylase